MSFKPNPHFESEARRDPVLRAKVARAAGELADRVEANSARIMPRQGRKVAEVVVDGENVYVVHTPPGAHLDEFGSRNNHPRAPMRRAISAMNLRLDSAPKPTA